MRIAVIVIAIAATAVGLVMIRRSEMSVRHDIQRLQSRKADLRMQLDRQEIEIHRLSAPSEVLRRSDEMNLQLIGKEGARLQLVRSPITLEGHPTPP